MLLSYLKGVVVAEVDRNTSEVLMNIAVALLLMQTAEKAIRLCMTLVLQKDSPLTLEKLEAQTHSERKKTLGYFLIELRKRVDLDEDFSTKLEQLLEDRNVLAHSLEDIPGWSLETDEGRAVALVFLTRCINEAWDVTKTFAALTMAWQKQIGMVQPNELLKSEEIFAEIEERSKKVNEIFFKRVNNEPV